MFSNNRNIANLENIYLNFACFTVNMMKKLGLFIAFLMGMSFAGAVSVAQELPSLPADSRISHGVLPDGISYYIVQNPSLKGYADFALVRRSCPLQLSVAQLDTLPRFDRSPDIFLKSSDIHLGPHGYVRISGTGCIVDFRDVMLTAGTEVTDSLLLAIFAMIDDRKEPSKDAVVISGDVDPVQMAYKLKLMSLMIPAYQSPDADSLSEVSSSCDTDNSYTVVQDTSVPGFVTLTFSCRTNAVPDNYMSTILPAVSSRLVAELDFVLERRLRTAFASSGITPVSMELSHKGKTDGLQNELYTLKVTVPSGDAAVASGFVGAVLSSIDNGGIAPEEYSQTASVFNNGLYREAVRTSVPNSEYVDRCADAFLYGSGLASDREKYDFFSSKVIRDTSGARLLGRFASELIDSSDCISFSLPEGVSAEPLLEAYRTGWRLGKDTPLPASPVPAGDTLGFPGPEEKCGIRLSRNDRVLGARLWVFANGIKVAYKRMDTDGMLYYSYVLKGGYSLMKNMKAGEGAFLSDMLSLCRISGMGNADFMDMLAVNGASMKASVNINNISVSGSFPSGKASLLLKSLLALSKSRTPDTAAVSAYMATERFRLMSDSASFGKKMFVLDSLLCGDDMYSPFKSASNLSGDLPERAMEFFDSRFSNADDGILVLVGDLPENSVKKLLQSYAGGFMTIGRRSVKPAVSYRMVSGESTYFVDGDEPGIDMLMSADLILNSENYMASRIAVMAIHDAMAAAVHDSGMYVSIRNSFSTYPFERFSVLVSAAYASETGIAESVQKDKLVMALLRMRLAMSRLSADGIDESRLARYKSVLSSRWDAIQSSPEYWVKTISGRLGGGKDLQSKYADRINSVTADDVLHIIRKLDKGSKIEYVTKEK